MNKYFRSFVELGTRPKDELISIVDHIWTLECFDGPYIDMSGFQPKGVPELYPYNHGLYGQSICGVQSHWGYATLPSGLAAPCVLSVGYYGREIGHCLEMSFRWEALNAAYQTDLNYIPDDRRTPTWYSDMECWFRNISEGLPGSSGYRLRVVGTETDILTPIDLWSLFRNRVREQTCATL